MRDVSVCRVQHVSGVATPPAAETRINDLPNRPKMITPSLFHDRRLAPHPRRRPFPEGRRNINLLQILAGIETDEAAVGRPEQLCTYRLGSHQWPDFERIHAAHPYPRNPVGTSRHKRELSPIRRDREEPAEMQRRLRGQWNLQPHCLRGRSRAHWVS